MDTDVDLMDGITHDEKNKREFVCAAASVLVKMMEIDVPKA